jgi:hypothetical protein
MPNGINRCVEILQYVQDGEDYVPSHETWRYVSLSKLRTNLITSQIRQKNAKSPSDRPQISSNNTQLPFRLLCHHITTQHRQQSLSFALSSARPSNSMSGYTIRICSPYSATSRLIRLSVDSESLLAIALSRNWRAFSRSRASPRSRRCISRSS